MDVTLKRKHSLTNGEALQTYKNMIDKVSALNGTCSCIFHNQYLCDQYGWEDWSKTFEQIWAYGAQKMD